MTSSSPSAARSLHLPLPLFPLQTVLFPQGRLSLKVFEARYLDLVSDCLGTGRPFGVVCLNQGTELRQQADGKPVRFESVGVLAEVSEVDADSVGLLKLRCLGLQRFRFSTCTEQTNGLWQAEDAKLLPDDPLRSPGAALAGSARALAQALAGVALREGSGELPPTERFQDAGWVANRWCELLPIPLAAKQKLMELEDPLVRLNLVDTYLRGKKVI